MQAEILSDWHPEDLQPTMEYLSFSFFRELRLMWRYRFLYRELVPLLRADPILKRR
jgi:hypothetical protein